MNDATNLAALDLATLRAYHRDASNDVAVCLPGTDTHRVRLEWLTKIAAELTRRGG